MTSHLEKKVHIPTSCYIADSASIIGDVHLGENCSVWYSAVIRGDQHPIRLGNNVNIQDNATVHVEHNTPTYIGNNVTVGHNAIVHACTIEDNVIVGMGSIILSGATIGEYCIIGAGSVIPEGTVIPPKSIVMGVPGKVRRQVTQADMDRIDENWKEYVSLIQEYKTHAP